ncbi:MAG: carbohydrate binding domain-containing protein [bacterium]|nr:carbohydrate binding domain-containing protein [bacterium]
MKNIISIILVIVLNVFSLQAKESNTDRLYQWFVRSQGRNGLVPSGEGKEYCFTYDEALSAMVFTLFGDLRRAETVFDFFKNIIQEQERCGKFSGFADMYEMNGNVGGASRAAGPNAWLLLAVNHYTQVTGNKQYLQMAETLAEWLASLEGIEGGITGGYDEKGKAFGWISTEHNLDCYAGFRDLYLLTGEEKFLRMSKRILSNLENFLWFKQEKRFFNGAMDANYATDVSSWAVCSLGKEYSACLDFAVSKSLTTQRYEKNNAEVRGFDFGATYWESHYPDKDSVWLEGTGQMVLAFYIAGRNKEADLYLKEMAKTVTPSEVHKGTKALPYATNPGTPAGSGWIMGPEPLCVSSTAWYLFCLKKFNPFSIQDLTKSNQKIRAVDEIIKEQYVPIVDDFNQGVIKCLTAYPLALQMKGDANIELRCSGETVSGPGALCIRFMPGREYEFKHSRYWSAQETKTAWAVIKRRFFRPQDWSGFSSLSLYLRSGGAPEKFRIKVLDRDSETWQAREIVVDHAEWKKYDFSFSGDFSKDGEAPVGNGNNVFDKDQVKEIMFSVKQGKESYESNIYLDEIVLEKSDVKGK